mmetsp:Transcript_6783/g.14615  ORF Transcript_6783/g.14615 Transcript_6783/m.14615 type:complete len:83 (-) Transcript_6783:304-552(-)
MNNFSGQRQVVKPPERGIFPLDHEGECKTFMRKYVTCIKKSKTSSHAECRDLSRNYLQCRMDAGLMANENLDKMGFDKKREE